MASAGSSRKEKVLAIVRIGLGTSQMFGAVATTALLLQTGLSTETKAAFTITTVLLCTSS